MLDSKLRHGLVRSAHSGKLSCYSHIVIQERSLEQVFADLAGGLAGLLPETHL